MQPETMIGAKLRDAGVDTGLARLYSEATRLLRAANGKPERALEKFVHDALSDPVLQDALALWFLREVALDMKGLPGEGHGACAVAGHGATADARRPNGDAVGQSTDAGNGQTARARPSPTHREREGQAAAADKAIRSVPSPREPSKSDVKAAAMVAKASAKAVLDIGWLGYDAIPGGPRYVDLRWRDIAGMVERQLKEGATLAKAALALRMIEREGEKLGQVDPERKWVDDLPADRVKAIARATEDDALKPSLVAWLRGGNELTQNLITEGHHAQ